MNRKRQIFVAVALVAIAIVAYVVFAPAKPLVLTGIVTTNDVIVSPQIGGQVQKLLVNEGDSVSAGQLLAVIAPGELAAEQAYYAHSAQGVATEVRENESAVRYQAQQMTQQVRQAEATVASAEAQRAQAAADYANAQTNYDRLVPLLKSGAISQQRADQQRTDLLVAKAKSEAADRQVDAQRAALELARGQQEQVAMKRSALAASQQERAAATAQAAKANVRLGYSEIRAPLAGIVDVRAVRAGEVVAAGAPILTLINPDDLWVRADVEESYIGRIKLGDHLDVRLPSGETRRATVFFRGVDAGFATQRDVSRSKRDIKTFEIRLRIDNKDRRLATGMTAYVLLPVS
ncbi:MAG TPA: efflux RND transporter periplasmic adaptor subunit [Gemmatimonadaceae bacterium]|nr:efflux RND transporter periplasmic adaptor subunit [Gemmatimonadaceae bacterium]